jgi:metal-responsive CopG/Arc/MetJ family transcriptional regulator
VLLRARPCLPAPVIPSYTSGMKTAISVPDETFEKASRRAHDLGMSRSEFFSRAATRYLDELDAESVTRQIDLAVAALAEPDDSSADAVVAGRRVLSDASGDW